MFCDFQHFLAIHCSLEARVPSIQELPWASLWTVLFVNPPSPTEKRTWQHIKSRWTEALRAKLSHLGFQLCLRSTQEYRNAELMAQGSFGSLSGKPGLPVQISLLTNFLCTVRMPPPWSFTPPHPTTTHNLYNWFFFLSDLTQSHLHKPPITRSLWITGDVQIVWQLN